jgi:selenocysteine-specific elongation factor
VGTALPQVLRRRDEEDQKGARVTPPSAFVVGTAGHIDHGKSHLVRALTGIDPDRLKEEQERGITIDLGFAHLTLPDGTRVGFVDVPGHERFVRNMLAGVGGIDLVLLVIAADESIKPQTREHFDICRLLRIPRGIVVLTKSDLVDAEILDLVRLEVREFVAGSFLERAPIVGVSVRTGQGLDGLKDCLAQAARDLPPRPAAGLPRLPIDRAFSIKGFGTVVTGTLVSGSLREAQEVVLLPHGARARVRGLETHNQLARVAAAGQRVAANLQGIDAAAIERGNLLTEPEALEPTHLLDVALEYLPGAPGPLRDLSRVGLHLMTTETPARVKVLGAGTVRPGTTAFAQLRAERPLVALPGDRFILRRHSPPMTVGGGVVLHNAPPKLRGQRLDVMARYERLSDPRPAARLVVLVEESEERGIDLRELRARTGLDPEEIARVLDEAVHHGEARALPTTPRRFLSAGAAERLRGQVTAALEAFHRREPLRAGLAREEIRTRVFADSHPDVFRCLLQEMAEAGVLRVEKDRVALAGHQVSLSAEDGGLIERLEGVYLSGGTNPPEVSDLASTLKADPRRLEKLLHLLLSRGRLTRIPDGKIFHAETIEDLKRRLWEWRNRSVSIDIAEFKDLSRTSRKNAIPLLEHLDQTQVTRREGSRRVILPPPSSSRQAD